MDEIKNKLTSVMLCSVFWISCPLNMRLTGCPVTLVTNYHFMLCNILQECKSHVMIWWSRPWFGLARSGSEWSSLVLCTWI